MQRIVILGAGTGGTIMANRLRNALKSELADNSVQITIVDEDRTHIYQPGLLFVPFGVYKTKADLVKSREYFLPREVKFVVSRTNTVDPEKQKVVLEKGSLDYDLLIIASGARIAPEENEGLTGSLWQKSVFDFYTLDGAFKLQKALRHFDKGRLVINIAEMPIKCPVAPAELAFLCDSYFRDKGIRDKVEIVYATPLSGLFTKPRASQALAWICEQKGIVVEPDFVFCELDIENKKLGSCDGRELDFDLMVSVPSNMGAAYVEKSGLGDELGWIPTDKHTLQSKDFGNIFVLGDATNIPAAKAATVAHFQSVILTENIQRWLDGLEPLPQFDGHGNCFIEFGEDKALLIDFNYDVEPLPGKFPLPGVGPFSLLSESRMNHFGKLMFRWAYWHLLLKGKDLPVSPLMTMSGKEVHA